MRILVTGGLGFIGSNFLQRNVRARPADTFVNVDSCSYAANPKSVEGLEGAPNYRFARLDLADSAAVRALFQEAKPEVVVHFAAESHVDRSIRGPESFLKSNVVGTHNLLEAARELWGDRREGVRFHHVSTDEVFGSLGESGAFTEETPYDPSSPYSATKAASDHLVRAWHRTFGLPVTISNCSNNYGPRQHPEKLMPLMILHARAGKALPVYGKGANVRDWLHVEDHCAAIELILEKGVPGRTYNVGGHGERTNMQVVEAICAAVAAETGRSEASVREQVRYVQDRPGHDFRYAIDPRRIESELGWKPRWSFEEGLRETVRWYLANESWCASAVNDEYRKWTQTHYGQGAEVSA
jgi:dTDP-glucose 4,6-dehydratase